MIIINKYDKRHFDSFEDSNNEMGLPFLLMRLFNISSLSQNTHYSWLTLISRLVSEKMGIFRTIHKTLPITNKKHLDMFNWMQRKKLKLINNVKEIDKFESIWLKSFEDQDTFEELVDELHIILRDFYKVLTLK